MSNINTKKIIDRIGTFRYANELSEIYFEGEIQNGKQKFLFHGIRILTDDIEKAETNKSQNI